MTEASEARVLRRDVDHQGQPATLVNEADPDGRSVTHVRVHNTVLDRLWRDGEGSITREQYDAGTKFQRAYQLAGLGAKYATLGQDRVSGGRHEMTDRQVKAYEEVSAALSSLSLTNRSACEFVVGIGLGIREWARRWRVSGGRLSDTQARRLVAGALTELALYYGMTKRSS